jgi:hypothetical protein
LSVVPAFHWLPSSDQTKRASLSVASSNDTTQYLPILLICISHMTTLAWQRDLRHLFGPGSSNYSSPFNCKKRKEIIDFSIDLVVFKRSIRVRGTFPSLSPISSRCLYGAARTDLVFVDNQSTRRMNSLSKSFKSFAKHFSTSNQAMGVTVQSISPGDGVSFPKKVSRLRIFRWRLILTNSSKFITSLLSRHPCLLFVLESNL